MEKYIIRSELIYFFPRASLHLSPNESRQVSPSSHHSSAEYIFILGNEYNDMYQNRYHALNFLRISLHF
jgi:hypothetical protein